mmetsp:Transcript_29061/g.61663  ORF Transcript_29061/g.61663 Transcript_29061/m.61663 type:complete len:212 (-) Transcript_29061:1374-2009(-)
MSTVLLGNTNAKLLCALAASHFCLSMGVPVNMGLSGSGLHACRTSLQLVRSSLGGRFPEEGSPSAGFQLRERPSGWTWRTRRRLLHHRDRPCLTTVMPERSRATKQRTTKSLALVQPVAGLKVERSMGMRTSWVWVAVSLLTLSPPPPPPPIMWWCPGTGLGWGSPDAAPPARSRWLGSMTLVMAMSAGRVSSGRDPRRGRDEPGGMMGRA